VYVSREKLSIRTRFNTSAEDFDFRIIIHKIISTTGDKYSNQQYYLINHWAPAFNIDITSDRNIKDLTVSLAMGRKDGSYDIYQIRKSEKDILSIDLVDKRDKLEELNNPVIADKLFDSLNNINWAELFSKIPEGEYYTLRSWGIYKNGEKIEINSGVYHNLSPKIAYIHKKDKIEEFINYDKSLVNEIVLAAIVPINKSNNGYNGKADIALMIELND
jgi:hypothetical protein